ncbi:hypothetical protein NDU88_003306 [Pleurodeles waltl]|uniref:Uncharacterized protein n=1 Tax=Pleurodeles waltl TaxID=8319 RepID=A0AAV7M314_PLEWA|nr:hypothetical protein NDU88_003306 [Pleurodeles waltl]
MSRGPVIYVSAAGSGVLMASGETPEFVGMFSSLSLACTRGCRESGVASGSVSGRSLVAACSSASSLLLFVVVEGSPSDLEEDGVQRHWHRAEPRPGRLMGLVGY